MKEIREWWLNLAPREKQYVFTGGCALTLLLIYALIWSPLANKVQSLREQIQHDQVVLAFMKETDKQIHELEKSPRSSSNKTASSLLGTVQSEINQTPFAKNISQLQQAENDVVSVHLQKVGFDNLIKWLTAFCQQQRVIVTQATVTLSDTPGIVDMDLKLQFG